MQLTLNELNYIMQETCNRLMLLEISNNAIETLLKKYNPHIKGAFDFTLGELNTYDMVSISPNTQFAGIVILNYVNISQEEANANPNMKIKDYLRLKIMKEFDINRGNGPIKFIRGIIRICCNENDDICIFDSQSKDDSNLSKFKQIVAFIYNNNLDFDEDFNGLSFEQLHRLVGSKMRVTAYQNWLANKNKKGMTQEVFGEYTVIPINSYEEASKYSRYTEWCVTHGYNAFNQYTGDGSKFFFCLKNGFEELNRNKGEACPLDEYGLSMVSVLVRTNCTAKHVTTRWNHDYGGEDNPKLKTLEQVEEVLGIPKNVFTDIMTPEIEFEDLQELIDNGVDISNLITVVDKIGKLQLVQFKSKSKLVGYCYNIMKDGKLLSDVWYTNFSIFEKNYIYMSRWNDERRRVGNVFDENGKLFPNDINYGILNIFDKEGDVFVVINSINGKNLIKRGSSEFILPEDVYNISTLQYDYAVVETREGYTNVLTKNLTYLFPEFKKMRAAYFHTYGNINYKLWKEGMLIMQNAFGWETYMDLTTGEPITDQWFKECFSFENGLGKVNNEEKKVNLIRHDGTLVSDIWFDDIEKFANRDYFRGKDNSKGELILDANGNIVINKYWDEIFDFTGKYGCVKDNKNNKIVMIDANGNELFSTDGLVGLVLDDIFFSLSPGVTLYDRTGKMLANNVTFFDENSEIQLPENYWGCIDNDKNLYYIYNMKQDIMKTFTDVNQVKEYVK